MFQVVWMSIGYRYCLLLDQRVLYLTLSQLRKSYISRRVRIVDYVLLRPLKSGSTLVFSCTGQLSKRSRKKTDILRSG